MAGKQVKTTSNRSTKAGFSGTVFFAVFGVNFSSHMIAYFLCFGVQICESGS
jgi:hypothetical protein